VHPRRYIDYLLHLLQADSRHGTHSPFVYRLVDELIYAKRLSGEPRDKVKRLTVRLIDRFQPRTVYTLGSEQPPISRLDFVVVDCGMLKKPVAEIKKLWLQLHAGSVLVLSDVYRNNESKVLWQFIKAQPDVTVTIDLFRAGLVFFHSGQSKEDFKIRF